jgi:hypothetical protein
MGLFLRFRCAPSPGGLHITDYCLAPFVHVHVLYSDLLLSFAAMAIEAVE